jgi:hypothetical protein
MATTRLNWMKWIKTFKTCRRYFDHMDNLAEEMSDKVMEMRALFDIIITDGRSNEGLQQENDAEVIRY